MNKFVFVVMTGVLFCSTPALSQPRTFLGTIEKDRHQDTVADLLEKAGCHKDWQKLAMWNQRSLKKPNWLRRLFTGKPKLPTGTRVYLDIPSLESCRLSPKEYVKAEAMGEAAADKLKRSLGAPPRETSARTVARNAYQAPRSLEAPRVTKRVAKKRLQPKESPKPTQEPPSLPPPPKQGNVSANVSISQVTPPVVDPSHGVGVHLLLILIGGVLGFALSHFRKDLSKPTSEPRIHETRDAKMD